MAIPSGGNTEGMSVFAKECNLKLNHVIWVSVCEFEEVDVYSSNYYTYQNIPDAKTCHGLCLKHQCNAM